MIENEYTSVRVSTCESESVRMSAFECEHMSECECMWGQGECECM